MLFKAIVYPLVIYLVYRLVAGIWLLDVGRVIYNHYPGKCRVQHEIVNGSEDVEINKDGLAFFTSGLRNIFTTNAPQDVGKRGRIFMFNMNDPTKGVIDLKINGQLNKDTFSPHGLTLWDDVATKHITLLVVNHASNIHTVERFQLDSNTMSLKHMQTHSSDHFFLLNDVAFLDGESFFFTNYKYTVPTAMFEALAELPWGSVGFYDAKQQQAYFCDDKLQGPNGIILSPDKRYAYVAGDTRAIAVYAVQRHESGLYSLLLIQTYHVHTVCDNLSFDSHNWLWAGCHPKIVSLLQYLHDASHPSPSQVLRMKVNAESGLIESMEQLLSDDGHFFAASTIAARHGNGLLVGSIQSSLLHCELCPHLTN